MSGATEGSARAALLAAGWQYDPTTNQYGRYGRWRSLREALDDQLFLTLARDAGRAVEFAPPAAGLPPTWVSVEERLPRTSRLVFIAEQGKRVTIGYLSVVSSGNHPWDWRRLSDRIPPLFDNPHVTHWAPIPWPAHPLAQEQEDGDTGGTTGAG